nr:response regulator transcription factor [Amycolatopsis sp. RTGN1]
MERVRVLVADDHPVFREGLCALLDAFDGIEVVGQAATGVAAVEMASRLSPDVVVMDLAMPGCNGVDATRSIAEANPDVAVVVLSMSSDEDAVFEAMQAGARGYLLKEAEAADVLRAIRAVADGDTVFGSGVAQRLIRFFASHAPRLPSHVFPELTDGERAVLDLVAGGRSKPQIAQQLMLSDKTIRNRVSSIFSKLHCTGRAEVIVKAREAGLGRR